MMRARDRQAGFTLIELVVVLAVFAMLALMGVQSITALVRTRDHLATAQDDSRDLAHALALLRADLDHMVALPFDDGTGQGAQGAMMHGGDNLAVTTAGRGSPPGRAESGIVRVIWRHDRANETFTRQVWPGLAPVRADARGPEQVMIEGVRDVRVASYLRSAGDWRDAFGITTDQRITDLPDGIRVDIYIGAAAPLRILVATP